AAVACAIFSAGHFHGSNQQHDCRIAACNRHKEQFMATAKKATKKTAAKKAAAKKTAAKKAATPVATTAPAPKSSDTAQRPTMSKAEARAAKEAASANAPTVKTTVNPEGSWPFPTGDDD